VLQVLDLGDPAAEQQAATVEQVLGQLDAADKPRVVALNKVDLLGPATRRRAIQAIRDRYPAAVPISARARTGESDLLAALDQVSRQDVVQVHLLVPYGREQVLNDLRQVGGLERTEYVAAGTQAWGWVPRRALHRFEGYSAQPRIS